MGEGKRVAGPRESGIACSQGVVALTAPMISQKAWSGDELD